MESVEIFSHTNVRTLLEHYDRAPLVPLSIDSSIFDVLLALGKYRNHRVVIVDGDRMVFPRYSFRFSLCSSPFNLDSIWMNVLV
jgi:hypothetical protein